MLEVVTRTALVVIWSAIITNASVLSDTNVDTNPIAGTQTVESIPYPLRDLIETNKSIVDKEINSPNNTTVDEQVFGNWSNDTDYDSGNAFENFPKDIMSEWVRNNGGVILHIFILGYCCLGLGIICDLYFLPALEIISETLSIPPDIAGATFMAMGTSAPELFTSIIGVFISQDDIGVGTILGTGVFNLIVIPAACGFAVMVWCPKTPNISRFPILRDSLYYILTIITLIICLKDNRVDWAESLILISLFIVYLVIMYFNAQYSPLMKADEEVDEEKLPLLEEKLTNSVGNSSLNRIEGRERPRIEWNTEANHSLSGSTENKLRIKNSSQKRISFAEVESEGNWLESNKFFKLCLMPLTLLFTLTLPKPTKCCFLFTFVFSIIWIGTLTYVCVWMVTIIGFTFGLPDTVSGLTLLAAGTSVPELISSVLVVKKASRADMAICNSIGSNIFDILFCLGVPWFLKSVIWMFQKGTMDLAATAVPIDSEALPLTTFTLLITIFALLATFHYTGWKLGLTVGITCSIIYVIFVIISSLLEIKLG